MLYICMHMYIFLKFLIMVYTGPTTCDQGNLVRENFIDSLERPEVTLN